MAPAEASSRSTGRFLGRRCFPEFVISTCCSDGCSSLLGGAGGTYPAEETDGQEVRGQPGALPFLAGVQLEALKPGIGLQSWGRRRGRT